MKTLFVALSMLCFLYACKKNDADSGPHSEPIYTENFSKDESTGFWTGSKDKDSLTTSLLNGFYQIANKTHQLHTFSINPVFIVDTGNISLETKLAIKPIDGNTMSYAGIIWGVNHSNGQVFVFGYFDKGFYNIWGFPKGGALKQYKKATPSPALKSGGFNKLRIERKNGILHFLINGTEVFKMSSKTSTLDRPGFIVDKQTNAQYDYFKAAALP